MLYLSICTGLAPQRAAQDTPVWAYMLPTPSATLPAPQIPTASLISKLHSLGLTVPSLSPARGCSQHITQQKKHSRAKKKRNNNNNKQKKEHRNSVFPLCFCRLFWWAAWNYSLLTCATGASTQPFFYLLFSKSLWAEATGDRLQCSGATAHPWAGMQHSEHTTSTEKGAEGSTWKFPTKKKKKSLEFSDESSTKTNSGKENVFISWIPFRIFLIDMFWKGVRINWMQAKQFCLEEVDERTLTSLAVPEIAFYFNILAQPAPEIPQNSSGLVLQPALTLMLRSSLQKHFKAVRWSASILYTTLISHEHKNAGRPMRGEKHSPGAAEGLILWRSSRGAQGVLGQDSSLELWLEETWLYPSVALLLAGLDGRTRQS